MMDPRHMELARSFLGQGGGATTQVQRPGATATVMPSGINLQNMVDFARTPGGQNTIRGIRQRVEGGGGGGGIGGTTTTPPASANGRVRHGARNMHQREGQNAREWRGGMAGPRFNPATAPRQFVSDGDGTYTAPGAVGPGLAMPDLRGGNDIETALRTLAYNPDLAAFMLQQIAGVGGQPNPAGGTYPERYL